ncbi:MAG: hypothetical protein ACLGHM_11345 [Actinomycetes bacterium]|jgi:hypothetical protein
MRRLENHSLGFVTSQKLAYWCLFAAPVILLWSIVAVFTWPPLLAAAVAVWYLFYRSTRRRIVVDGGRATYHRVWGTVTFDVADVTGLSVTITGVVIDLGRESLTVPSLTGVEFARAREAVARDIRQVLELGSSVGDGTE